MAPQLDVIKLDHRALQYADKVEYTQKLLQQYNVVNNLLQNARSEHQSDVFNSPVLRDSYIPKYVDPLKFKTKPYFKTKFHRRLVQTQVFRQPFSNYSSLLTVAQDGSVVLWDEQSHKRYESFNIGRGATLATAVNGTGSLLACGGLSCFVEIYSIGRDLNSKMYPAQQDSLPLANYKSSAKSQTGRPDQYRFVLSGHDETITGCTYVTDDHLLTSGLDGMVFEWDLITGKECFSAAEKSGITALAYNGVANNCYITALRNGTVQIGDTRTAEPSMQLLKNPSPTTMVKVLPDGNTALCAHNNRAQLVDLRSTAIYRTLKSPHGKITAFDVSASGKVAVFGTDWGSAVPIDLLANQWSPPFVEKRDRVSSINIVEDQVYVSNWDGTLTSYVRSI